MENNKIFPNEWMCICGTNNDNDSVFCENCGAKKPIPLAPEKIKFTKKQKLIATIAGIVIVLCIGGVIIANISGHTVISPKGTVTTLPTLPLKIVAGVDRTLALTTNGSLWEWGTNNNTPKQIIASGVKAAAASYGYSFAVKTDGSLWAWGDNGYGQLGDGTITDIKEPKQIIASGVTEIATDYYHTLALKTDGSLWVWGVNYNGELGLGTMTENLVPEQIIASGVTAIATGSSYSLALKTDGSLWAWGGTEQSLVPKQIIASGVKAIAGSVQTLALKTDGSLWAWGNNGEGQLGDGTKTNSTIPKQIIASGVTAIAAGRSCSLALKEDGSLWAWGDNENGQLGDGTTTPSLVPKKIIASGIEAMATSGDQSFAIKTDGSIWAWGQNLWGGLGDGTTTQSLVPKIIIVGTVTGGDVNQTDSVTNPSSISEQTSHPAVLSSQSNAWHFANKSGYTYNLTIKIWAPILGAKSGITVHPADAKDTLGSDLNFNPATDLVIPAALIVEDTTENFKADIGASVLFANNGDTGSYIGTGIPPTSSDNRISVEEFFNAGPKITNYSSTNGGYGQTDSLGGIWSSMTHGQTGSERLFIVIHNYFSPALPNGDTALLDWITLRPKTYGSDATSMFYDADGNSNGISTVGITLSGHVIKPQ